ncbi:MAG: lycopene cyclase domain-containing protein [Blastochloris sp.]|nr:lycopene cyclase domain-containing protein [Blastochloris sp.]
MTYSRFHWIFNFPFLLLCAVLAGPSFWTAPILTAVALVLSLVMVFTTPWDNYAVAQGIWGFPRNRFSFKIWHLPIEEYAFFLIESIQVMLLTTFLFQCFPQFESWENPYGITHPLVGIVVGSILLGWLVLGLWGRKRINAQSCYHYAWHLLFWFVPIIFLQWAVAWDVVLPRWPVLLGVTFLVGTYLSIADYIAIDKGIWHFDAKQITGYKFGGKMPWEEAAFFYLTAFLVAQSFIILLPEQLR